MARYRTVKPELWTDAAFVECSPNARLLFVAALNFASDFGVLPDHALQLKMQCFPGDSIEVEPLIDELVAAKLWLATTSPDGEKVLVVRTFLQHQKVDKPTDGRWGDWRKWGPLPERSRNAPRTVVDPSSLKERTNEQERTNIGAGELSLRDAIEVIDPKGATRQEDLWAALGHELGDAKTTTERNIRGKTMRELKDIGATPEQVHERCREYRNRFQGMSLTDSALVKHWSSLAEAKIISPHMNHSTAALLRVAERARGTA